MLKLLFGCYDKLAAVFCDAPFCGCFWPTIVELANGSNAIYYLFFSFIGVNFLVELGSNVILSPVVTTLINAKKRIDA